MLKLEILLPMDLQGTSWTMIALCTSRTHVQLTIASEESDHTDRINTSSIAFKPSINGTLKRLSFFIIFMH